MSLFWKKLAAAVVGTVCAMVTGFLIVGIIVFFPLTGIFLQATLLGGLALIIGALIYEFGEVICRKLFGWFY